MEIFMSTVESAVSEKGTLTRSQRRKRNFYFFISPWLIGFILLTVVPLVFGFLISLTNYNGLNLFTLDFVGFKNFAKAFQDPMVRFTFSRTLIWTGLNLPVWLILSLFLAIIVNQKVHGIGIFRTIFYLPSVIPAVGLVWTWKILLEKNYGLLNSMISVFRPGTAIGWLTDQAMYGVTAMAVWSGLGAGMIIFLAGMQSIPDELIEAAKIDGANTSRIFWHVILPMLTPVIFFQLILGLISALQMLTIPWLATTDSVIAVPPRGIHLYMIYIYEQIFSTQRFGYGMAILWLLIIIVFFLTFLIFRTQNRWVYSEVEG
jgi:multiple sugar transport system permease protein